MPVRTPAILLAVGIFAASVLAVGAPQAAHASTPKVVIIVGPSGGVTNQYRSMANEVAAAAEAAGATVVKVYSPNATWSAVRSAVNGANVVVYFGHGNGYPNPYGSTELTDRTNGWGLNRTTTNGDSDIWSSTMVYCGEKALLGTLTASSSAQWSYCGGSSGSDGIDPAPGFVMVMGQAHYAPGFGERYNDSDPLTTLAEAQARVRHYSYPVLALGASAYIATAYGDADEIVTRVLTENRSFGEIFSSGDGYSGATLTQTAHPDVGGASVWVQRTVIPGFHFGDPDYWYAFAGDPSRTPSGGTVLYGGYFSDVWQSPFRDDIIWLADSGITAGCAPYRFCPTGLVTREQMASFLSRAFDLPAAPADFFTDDNGRAHEADDNRLAASRITGGCAPGRFCPTRQVTREQMASFLARALNLPRTSTDFFTDDEGSQHESDINRLAASGITGGCAAGRFCPRSSVTRGQMAAFLHRALGD